MSDSMSGTSSVSGSGLSFWKKLLFGTAVEGAVGCKGREKEELRKIKTPIWSKEQLEETLKKKGLVYATEVMRKPPFYRGPMPLKFEAYESYLGMYGSKTIYAHEFNGFRTVYVYISGELEGAATFDANGKLVAEARVNYSIIEDDEGLPTQGRELEEFHYDRNGKLIFTCKSKIDPDTGFKVKESNKVGRKINEFYFLWPSGFGD